MSERSVWIGFDPREAAAYAVCRYSINRALTQPIPVKGIILSEMQERGLYTRPMERRGDQLWDVISDAPMSTEFAISRFLTPHLAARGWAVFMDCDILCRTSLARLFEILRDKYAVMVVKHKHIPDYAVKMDGQTQTRYPRKNWSSVIAFNCEHESNKKLTIEMVNTLPGRDLHRFCWLQDEEIGELDKTWNYLVGHTTTNDSPNLVHFTDGVPGTHRGFENCEYHDEYERTLEQWAA